MEKLALFNNLPRICQHTICSASISLLTGPGTAQRLFFPAYSTIFSTITISLAFGSFCSFSYCEILFSRFKHDFGIRGTALDWFRSFFRWKTICPPRRPKINRNVPGIRCSSRLCAGPCTVHFVYNTIYMPHRKALSSARNVRRRHTTQSL